MVWYIPDDVNSSNACCRSATTSSEVSFENAIYKVESYNLIGVRSIELISISAAFAKKGITSSLIGATPTRP